MKELHIIVNDTPRKILVGEHDTLARVLRDQLHLPGTKIGCEQGSCGACTVLVNDTAVQSCIAPALKYNGSQITTIEGISKNGKLHALQEQFVNKGAIQCGYCTPGMVLTTLSFLKENKDPSDKEIREALSGNLCRCTGYTKIIEAIREYASTSLQSEGKDASDDGISSRLKVGEGRPYLDAVKKVTGTAEFADDIYVHNPLYCKFLRSVYPHAEVVSLDTSEAKDIPGVRLISTGNELPISFGVLPISEDETAMAIKKTRYIGEIVAAVVADSEEIALKACKAIKVKYRPLRAFLDMEDSLEEVPEVERIHSHGRHQNNVHKQAELRFGDQKEGLRNSYQTCKESYEFQGLNHGFTEPHSACAWWDNQGLTVLSSTQVPHYLHRYLAKVLEVPMNQVRVIKPFVGGGFGGKSDPFPHEIIIAHMARKLGRPVKVRLTREEVFITNHGRHPTRLSMEIGVNKDGKFEVLDTDIIIDGGAFASFGVVTSYYNGVLLQAPYKIDNLGFRTRRVYTNKPQCGAMRGHGAVNSRFAIETLIDRLAEELDMDPCDLRFRNFLGPNTTTVGQYRITSNGVKECLEKVMDKSDWLNNYRKLPEGRGYGVACGFFISGSALPIHWNEYPQSVVHLKVDLDGRVLITSGASDIGQGSDTMLGMIVAEVLGLSADNIALVTADTLLTPIDLGSYSSRVTFMAGNAAKEAAEKLKNIILGSVASEWKTQPANLKLADEIIFSKDKKMTASWSEAVEIATRKVGALTVSGSYNSPKLGGDFKGAGAGLSPSYSFGAVVAEVEVDLETGFVKVWNIWGAHDPGKAINPLAVEGQLEGSWHMGIGQAISEQMKFHNGLLLNGNFLDYKIPTTLDTPGIHTNIVETADPEGPFGAKECGEGALHPAIPAVANAIYDAVGVRITALPVNPETILKKMKERELMELESN